MQFGILRKTQYGGCVFWAEAAAEKNDGGLVSAAAAAAIRGHFGREDGQEKKPSQTSEANSSQGGILQKP